MPSHSDTKFLVSAHDDPVVLRIRGKANYLNCACIGDFFDRIIASGRREFVVDLCDCAGMDSTFLGILASAGLQLREMDPPGKLVLLRLSRRNLELVRNLGLHHILTIDDGTHRTETVPGSETSLGDEAGGERMSANTRLVLKAHQALSDLDESNRKRFQDVIAFLQRQIDDH